MLFYNPYYLDITGQMSIQDVDDYTSLLSFDNIIAEEIKQILEEEEYEFTQVQDQMFAIDSPIDELIETFLEYELFNSEDINDLQEGVAKRAIVVRKGKRKVIFKCKPGEKKIGRRCARRKAAELNKMKRSAKRAARKAKSKKSRAKRLRKFSLKRRETLVKNKK